MWQQIREDTSNNIKAFAHAYKKGVFLFERTSVNGSITTQTFYSFGPFRSVALADQSFQDNWENRTAVSYGSYTNALNRVGIG